MANKIQYTIGLNVDTNTAKNTLSSLQRQLQSVADIRMKVLVDDADIKSASFAAQELQTHLNKAINQDTGKLDLTKFMSSIKNANTSLSALTNDLLKCGQQGTAAFTQLITAIGQTQAPIRQTSKLLSDLGTTLKNTVKWQLSSNLVHGLQSGLSHAISYAKDLNEQLTNIGVVTGKTTDQMAQFAIQANKAAKELSTTTKAYTQAALIYYQQGDSDDTVAKKAALTIKATNVAFKASAQEMSDMLTAVWNSYQAGEEELEHYIDVMAALGATTATSTEEIAIGMQKVASTANAVGVTMEQMSSIIATVSSVTRQSAESIGTAYKTILARMQDLKMGETLDDGVTLGKISGQLNAIGINVLDATGNLRDMGTVIEELGAKWQTLSRAQQVALAEVLAGKRQYTQLYALMENMDKYQANMQTAKNSDGTLEEQNARWEQSWEAASNRVKANLETIYSSILDDKALIGLTNGFAELINKVGEFIKSLGGIQGVLALIGSIAANVFSNQIVTGLKNAKASIMSLTQAGRQALYNKNQQTVNQEIDKAINNSAITESQRIQINATQKLMQMKAQLGEVSKTADQSQIAGLQTLIGLYETEQNSLVRAMEAKKTATETYDKALADVTATVRTQQVTVDSSIDTWEAYINAINKNDLSSVSTVNKNQSASQQQQQWEVVNQGEVKIKSFLQSQGQNVSGLAIDDVQGALNAYQQLQEVAQNTNAALQEGKQYAIAWGDGFKNTESSAKELSDTMKAFVENTFGEGSSKAETFKQKIADALKQEDAKGALSKILAEINNDLENTSQKANQFAEALKNIIRNNGSLSPAQINTLCDAIDRMVTAEVAEERQKKKNTQAEQDYQNALAKTRQGFSQTISKVSSIAMGMVSLNNSIKSVTRAFSEGGTSSEKFMAILSTIPSLLTMVNSATQIAETISKKHAVAKLGEASATKIAEMAAKSYQATLLPLLIVMGAVIAAITIWNAVSESNKKAQEEENKAMTKVAESAKERVEQSKKEREELQKTYNAWSKYEEERQKTGEAGDEYVSATEAVLEALDREELKVYLVMQRYEDLANKIKEANRERLQNNAAEANTAYTDIVNANTTLGNNVTRNEANDLGWANTTIDHTEVRGGKTSFIWAGKNLFYDDLNTANKGRKKPIHRTNVLSIMTRNGITLEGWNGYGDIKMGGMDDKAYMKFASDWNKARTQIKEAENWDIENTSTGQVIKEFIKTYITPIVNAYNNKVTAGASLELSKQYGDKLAGENGAEWYANSANRAEMTNFVKNYLVAAGVDQEEVDDLVATIIDQYIGSFGTEFAESLNKAQAARVGQETVKTYTDTKNVNIDEVRNKLATMVDDVDEYLGYITDVHQITGDNAESIAKSIETYGDLQKIGTDFIQKDLAQQLEDGKQLIGTDDIATLEPFFKQYYGKEYESYWKAFLIMSKAAQEETLGSMSKNAPNFVKDRLKDQGSNAQALLDNSITAQTQDVTKQVYAAVFGTQYLTDGSKNKYYNKAGDDTIDSATWNQPFDFGTSVNLRQALQTRLEAEEATIAKQQGYQATGDSQFSQTTLDNAIKYRDYIKEQIETLDGATSIYQEAINLVNTTEVDTATSNFKFDPTKDFSTIETMLSKSPKDYTTSDWQLLEGMTGLNYEKLTSVLNDYTSDIDWNRFVIENARAQRRNNYVTQERYDKMSDGQKAIVDQHGGIITQQEADAYDRQIDKMEYNNNLTSTNTTIAESERISKNAQTYIQRLNEIDVTKLPETGSQADTDLTNALTAAGEDYLSKFKQATSNTDKIRILGEAKAALYQQRADAADRELIELRALLQDTDENSSDYQNLVDRIAEKEKERDQALRDKEKAAEQTTTEVDKQLKSDYADLNAEASKTIANLNEIKSLSSIDLSKMPQEATAAYKALEEQLKKDNKTMRDFYQMGRAEQIKFLGNATTDAYRTEIAEYDKLIEQAKNNRKEASKEAQAEWDTIITDLEHKRQVATDNLYKSESATFESLSKYYQNIIKTLDDQIKKDESKITKRENQIGVLAKNILTDNFSMSDQVGQEGIDDWALWSPTERAKYVSEQYTDSLNEHMRIGEEKITRYANAKNGVDTMSLLFGTANIEQMLTGGTPVSKDQFVQLLEMSGLDETIKGTLLDAWDSGIASLTPDKLAKMNWTDVGNALKQELVDASDLTEEEMKQALAVIYDNIADMYSTISEKELQIAQDTVEAWKTTFEKIIALRKQLIMGEDISGSLLGSLDDFTAIFDAYVRSTGKSLDEFIDAYKKGTLKAENFVADTPDKFAENLKASLGIDKLFGTDNKLLSQDELAEKFGISKGTYTDKKGIFDEKAYNDALRAAVEPYIRNLLSRSGKQSHEIDSILAQYWSGSGDAMTEAIGLIEAAGLKMNGVADKYTQLYTENAELEEAKSKYDAAQKEQIEIAKKNEDKFTITNDLRTGRNASSITQLTNDFNRKDYMAEVNKALSAKGYDQIESLNEMETWDFTDERWTVVSDYFKDGSIKAKEIIVQAGKDFRDAVLQKGFDPSTKRYKAADEIVTAAETDLETTKNGFDSDLQDSIQSQLDLTSTRQDAISTAINLTSSSSTEERIAAAQALREAYVDADEATRNWAESMARAVEAGEDLTESNKALTTANLRMSKSYNSMTKQQRLQWREILKTNKVTVAGYKTLDEYFEVLDKGANIYDEVTDAAQSFKDRGITAITDVLKTDTDKAKDGLQRDEKELINLITDFLPDAYDTVAPELFSLSQDYAGDINAYLQGSWDETTNTFKTETAKLLEAMGLSKEQILAMQNETRAALENNAKIGEIDFLSMMANMDIDPTVFDSMITALNNAMHQIEATLKANGMELDPPWTDIPTLSSKGIGNSKGGSGSTGKNKGSGGGGGSKSAKKVEGVKRGVNEKDRYHEITERLERQSKSLERLDKIKSRAFGANKLKAIQDEIDALEKETKLYEELANEANANVNINRRILQQYGATFNDDGTVNYDEYMDSIIERYNDAVKKYNSSAQKAADELMLKEAEAKYEEAKKALEDYEEDLDKLEEAQNNFLENQNKISETMLEGIQYKVEVKLDLNDRDIKLLQHFRDKWEDLFQMQDESMRTMTEEALKYENNLKTLGTAMNELNAAYHNGTLNEANYSDGMQDVNDKMVEQLDNLLTVKKFIKEAYGETLSKANEEIEKYTAVIDHSHSVLEQYIEMQQLMGLGADYFGLQKMYQVSYDSSVANIKAAKDYLEVLKNSKEQIEANVAEHGWTDELKQQWADVNAEIQEGEDNLLEQTNQALTDAQNLFSNTMQAIVQDFDEKLFDMKNGLSSLEDDYKYYQEEQERYLSTSKELYEVSKLNRQINDSITDSTTKASKERLKALQEQIKAQSESTRLTEYDVQMLELQYKYALALDDLENAKNAKSTVRLTRDENGNYGYQYTADEDKINESQQQVEDVLQQINELAAERVNEIEQNAVQAEREYRDALLEIAADTTLTLEERQQKMEELTRRYSETMLYNQEQYGNATSALLTNQQYVYDRYGQSILDNTGMIQDQMNTSVAAMIEKTSSYGTFLQEQLQPGGQIYEALQTYKDNISIVTNTSGLNSWENMVASSEDFEEANKAAAIELENINDQLGETLTNISDVTDEWLNHADVLDSIINKYEQLAQAAANAVRAAAGDMGREGPEATSGIATQEELENTEKQWLYSWAYNGYSGTWSGYDSRQAALKGAKSDIYQAIMSSLEAGETDEETASNRAKLQNEINAALRTIEVTQYLSGGLIDYTGPAWVDGSLGKPEMILNADDTQKMMNIVDTLHDLDVSVINDLYHSVVNSAMSYLYALSSLTPGTVNTQSGELQQNVHIEADFPNVTDKNEIVDAFNDLVNMASQYANRR